MVLADSHRIPRAPCYSGKPSQTRTNQFRLRGYHPLRHAFPDDSATGQHTRPLSGRRENRTAPQPRTRNPCRVSHAHGLTIIRFRSPLLTESLRFIFLRVLRCFSSPGSLCLRSNTSSMYWVAPFGYLRINSCVPIPVAFRSLPRPSSPLKA